MTMPTAEIWFIIVVLGAATYLLRFSFLGLLGDREMPRWVLRLLRYTPVAVFPALVAPLVMWPAATGGTFDPARGLAVFATLAVGYVMRSVLWGILAGAAALYLGLWLI